MMWRSNNPTCVDRTFQITRHKDIYRLVFQLVARGLGLLNTAFIEFTLQMPLQKSVLSGEQLQVAGTLYRWAQGRFVRVK